MGMMRINNHQATNENIIPLSTSTSSLNNLTSKDNIDNSNNKKRMTISEQHLMSQGLSTVFDPNTNNSSNLTNNTNHLNTQSIQNVTLNNLDFSDMPSLLTQPIPKGLKMNCYIIRNKKGLRNKMFPLYELYLEDEDYFLLAGKKDPKIKPQII